MYRSDCRINLGSLLKFPVMAILLASCETQQKISQPLPDVPTTIGRQDQLMPSDQSPRDSDYYLSRLFSDRQELPIKKLRYNALKETALGFGSQTGYQERYKDLTRKLETQSNHLSVVFDFGRVASFLEARNGYLLSPVVARAYNAVQTNPTGNTLTSSDEYLTIQQPGRLIPVLPSWRDYLLIPTTPINNPPSSLIPRDKDEKKLFDHYFANGWRLGESQANDEFKIRIGNLQQTYQGMLNYLELVNHGIITRMIVVNADMANLKDKNSLRINNRIVQIVSQSTFEANPDKWRIPHKTDISNNLAIKTNHILE